MSDDRRVSGIGGIFFKARDPEGLTQWYRRHLGVPADDHGMWLFRWRTADKPERSGTTVWSAFPDDTDYFGRETARYMINYRVDDIDAVLALLRDEGVWIDEKREDSEYGRFAWIADPEGNRVELWQPPEDR
jgi:catechol 2,3-dioxygenase-like lactoylglutathione lyase family enzyme